MDPGQDPAQTNALFEQFVKWIQLREAINDLRYHKTREEIWSKTRSIRTELHQRIADYLPKRALMERLTGLALSAVPEGVELRRDDDGRPSFQVHALREARRLTEDGRVLNQVFVTILQTVNFRHGDRQYPIRCGSTLVIDLDGPTVKYVVRKGLRDVGRLRDIASFREGRGTHLSLRSTYFGAGREPFAALHLQGA